MTVVLLEPVSLDNALSPSNDSERLLFRNLSDNLIRLDCQGEARAGLAESWSREPGGAWTLTLGDSIRSPARGRVSASDIVARLTTDTIALRALGLNSIVALDSVRLRVDIRGDDRDSAPRLLADPALALMDKPASDSMPARAGLLRPHRQSLPAIEFRFTPGGDARDALDRNADLLVTRDPALVDYVSTSPSYTTFPLPWSRTYLLLTTGQQPDDIGSAASSSAIRASLASDAVRAEARAADPPFWWTDVAGCRNVMSAGSQHTSARIVYREDDEVARGLAQRLVALTGTAPGLRAAGLDSIELAKALQRGSERAYVIGVARQSLAPCRDASALPAAGTLTPLIDTRAYAIVRKGAPPFVVEWDGTIRMAFP